MFTNKTKRLKIVEHQKPPNLLVALASLLVLALPLSGWSQFTFTTNNGAITITGYTGPGGSVTIPSSTNGYPVNVIGYSSFMWKTNVTSVTIPNSVTNIGGLAFYGCTGLTNVAIPNSVISIGNQPFVTCSALTNIIVDAANPSYASRDGVLFNKSLTVLIQYPGNSASTYAVPNSVTNIGVDAFGYCTKLKKVNIPNSVTTIGPYAFERCKGLTNIVIPNGVTAIGDCAFIECGLKSVTIPDSVTSILKYAFSACSLKTVTIPNSVTSLRGYVFEYCSDLHQAYFMGNAPSVNGGAGSTDTTIFHGETGTVYYEAGTTGWAASFGGWPTAQLSGIASKIVGVSGNLAFGSVGVGETATRSLVITNSGTRVLTISNITCSAGFSSAWSGYIPPNQSQTITVTFSPAGAQSYAGDITVASDASSGNSTLPISGSGEIPSKVVGVSGNLAFGSVPVGESATRSLVITNSGIATLTVSNITYPAGFSGAWSGSIPAGSARTVMVTFSPAAAQSYAGNITVISDATSGANSMPISGNGYVASPPGDFKFIVNNGTITITGYIGSGGNVVIPSVINSYPVAYIGNQAFLEKVTMTSVTIPDSITQIGNHAFDNCSGLTNVVGGNSVSYIGYWAFAGCSSLTSLAVPSKVVTIGEFAFSFCFGLSSVAIPDSVASIGNRAFLNCSGLTNITVASSNPSYASLNGVLFNKSITTLVQYPGGLAGAYVIPNSVTSIGYSAFEYCLGLTNVTIPDSVTSIGDWAFYACHNITSVTIPNSVKSIGEYAFATCSLTNVTIPNSVTSIGLGAFAGLSLTSVTIPNSVTSIGNQVFNNCPSLTNIIVDAANQSYASLSGVLFNKSITTLVRYPEGLGGTYAIPDGVTSIGYGAFSACSKLTSVTFPNSVRSIGVWAFDSCSSLTNVVFGDGLSSIGDEAFRACIRLSNIAIPNSVTSIGNAAFIFCASLTHVTLGSGVTNFSGNWFSSVVRHKSCNVTAMRYLAA